MARKLRLEYPGALYHVINRGNYRSDIFEEDSTKAAFERCAFEAAEKWKWLIHAFVLMRNHFHFAVETTEANLVLGMQWLQATFANRFNRLRREHGHLFQGRYRALLIGGESMLGEVCDYLHLNPAIPKIISLNDLADYRYSSYWYLHRPQWRPAFLRVESALKAAGFDDKPSGWESYQKHLAIQLEAENKTQRRYVHLTQGWAIGTEAFRATVIARHAPIGSARAWTLPGALEMRAAQWEQYLPTVLTALGHTLEEAQTAPKSAIWKLAAATWMRDSVHASNGWLSSKLTLGHPVVVSRNLLRYRANHQRGDANWQQLRSRLSG